MAGKIYLHNTPLKEAREIFEAETEIFFNPAEEQEEVTPAESPGRVTAAPVYAPTSSPHYFASAMDGVAVLAEDTYGAAETSPLRLKVGEKAHFVDTGQLLPRGCNAVILIEHVNVINREEIEIHSAVSPWQHVRSVGEDILSGELVLPAYHRVRPVDIGVMISAGVKCLQVIRKPRVAVIPTGNEIVPPGTSPEPGQIVDSNSCLFGALIQEWGGEPVYYPVVPDDPQKIKDTLMEAAAQNHLVLVGAGSSAGRKDHTAAVVEKIGSLLVHGVAIRPGKPVVLGKLPEAPVVGVPGYPVSALLVMELLVKTLLYRWQQQSPPQREMLKATVNRRVVSGLKEEEYLRVRVGRVKESYAAVPLQRGAGVLSSVLKADGWVRIPQEIEGLEAGSEVEVELLREKVQVDNNILCTGSHDLSLDVLYNLMCERRPGSSLASAHVGSMGGIMAIKKGETHLAPVHLLDPESGEYNVPYLKRYLEGEDVVLVHLLYREQGLILPPGNPRGINDINDLVEKEVQFINRQRGAGTRIFFDHELSRRGIDSGDIQGYHREEYNHLAVAAAVHAGTAGAGIGIMAAAQAYGLDFVPLTHEKYELVIPRAHWQEPRIANLLEVASSREFAERVERMGGYDLRDRGKVVWKSSE